MKKVVSELKGFMNKGNVLDLAVAVVLGTSFNAVVNTLANKIISPAISYFIADLSFDNIKTVLKPESVDEAGEKTAEIALEWGVFFRAAISFIITAFFIFVALKLILYMKGRFHRLENRTKEEAKRALQYLDGNPATPAPRLTRKQRKQKEKEEAARLAEEERKRAEEEKEKNKSEAEKQRELLQSILENLESINKNTAQDPLSKATSGAGEAQSKKTENCEAGVEAEL